MALIDFHLPLRHLHVALVSASVGLFALRGGAVLAGHRWPTAQPLRLSSMALDTLLLAAGVTLWAMLGLDPRRDAWLAAKLALLLAYIVLGSLALRRAPGRSAKAGCYVAALACAAWMVSIALAHHPLGLLRPLAGT
jgi:uncharacterized membrane protein SirB2